MCILKCILKHRILRKIRATFLSLSEEKKATSAGLKRLYRSRRPLAYSLVLYKLGYNWPNEEEKLFDIVVVFGSGTEPAITISSQRAFGPVQVRNTKQIQDHSVFKHF